MSVYPPTTFRLAGQPTLAAGAAVSGDAPEMGGNWTDRIGGLSNVQFHVTLVAGGDSPDLVGRKLYVSESGIVAADGEWIITAQDGPLCTIERDGLIGTVRLEP